MTKLLGIILAIFVVTAASVSSAAAEGTGPNAAGTAPVNVDAAQGDCLSALGLAAPLTSLTSILGLKVDSGLCALLPGIFGPNLLQNGDFEQPGPGGPVVAAHWTIFNNAPGTTTKTELVPATLPFGGEHMIHVSTTGQDDGIVQVFGSQGSGPQHTISWAFIYVIRGQVGIGTGNGGSTHIDKTSVGAGHWEVVFAPNGVSPSNEFIVYATSPGGAEYYVDNAVVKATH